ncbi:MAG TPA: bifunctional PIG-L family deacetylase/class I SAM-dependent methyltransferase [Nakamurella sp.]
MSTLTATFDRRDPGTSEERWRSTGILDRASPLDLAGVRRIVVLSAHPDDEALGAAGLIRRMHSLGAQVDVIVATDGEGSHPGSPTHSPERIAALRRAEMRRALRQLAPRARLRRLGLPDGDVAAHHEILIGELRAAIGQEFCGTLLVAPWRDDGHPDHQAVARAVERVARETGTSAIEFPIWGWLWADPDDPRLDPSRLAVLSLTDDERAAKERSIGEHRSQVRAIGDAPADEPVLTERFLRHFRRPYEIFLPFRRSLTSDYFDRLYRDSEDPWQLGRNWYEQRKRDLTVAALPRPRFRSAFEPGCAGGLLTERLASRCDRLLATDIAATPVDVARRRVAGRPNVRVELRTIPRDWPDLMTFDLIVLSEIGYYLDRTDLSRLIVRTVGSLASDGVVVACHWLHPALGYPLTGDQVQAAFVAESGLSLAATHQEEDFRLDVLTAPGMPSVARWEGLLP